MHASQILRADLLDIIFENRNKAYGAYALRKFYGQQIIKSMAVVLLLIAVFAYMVMNMNQPELLPVRASIPEHRSTLIFDEPPVVKPRDKPQLAKPDQRMSNKFVFVDSLLLDTAVVKDDPLHNAGSDEDIAEPVFAGVSGGEIGPSSGTPHTAHGTPFVSLIEVARPVEKADIDPTYPGGLKALTKFLERNLQNPEDIDQGESISVKVKFVVGYDGGLKAFEVKEDGGKAFNEEVIRVLKKMPRWIPGKTNGQNVSVYFTIPVKFINEQ